MATEGKHSILVDIVIASVIIGLGVYYVNKCFPDNKNKDASVPLLPFDYSSNASFDNSAQPIEVIEFEECYDDCIFPDNVLENYPDNIPSCVGNLNPNKLA